MSNIYFSKLKLALMGSILFGGLSYAQVFQLTNGEMASGNDVSDNGIVVLSSTTGNYMWTEEGGLVTLNTFTNGTNNSGNPSISNDGTRISATITNPNNNLNEMGVYDVATNSWNYLGGIGGVSDNQVSSSWSMSGDGQILVGLGWVNAGSAHAIKWSQAGGMVDMGSTVTGRSTRANDANLDGSIIVGWQDSDFGFRQAAIWEGTNQTLIFDEDGMEVSEAGAISADGNWVIGGDYNFNAWKWSETTGVEAISHPDAGMWFRGASTDISSDGSIIIGYYRPWPGGPYFGEGFIWTEETGRIALNDYVDGLGIDRQGISLNLPLGMSSDGSMIVGGGINANNEIVGFLVKLTSENEACEAVNVPYIQDFESSIVPDMPECTSVENAGSGNTWTTHSGNDGDFTGTYLRYQWHTSSPANTWFYTQGINMTAGTAYKITYDYGSAGGALYFENLKVAYGSEAANAAMTNTLAVHEGIGTSYSAETNVVEFSPTTSGVYYFGFQAYSDIDQFYLYVDNIKVELAGDIEDPVYCEPELDCTDGDLITNVTFQEINNDSDCSPNGFGDYTSMVANVESGGTYPISVTVGSGWAYESVSVWIDYDNSFTFDEDEFTFIGTGSGNTLTSNITIPADVAEGEYRMRVRVAAVGDTTATWEMACDEDQGYGETEDYTVNIGTLGMPSLSTTEFAYYPNPVNDVLNINSQKEVQSLQIFNLAGQKVMANGKITNGQINVQNLPAGTYVFRVVLEGGQVETFKIIKK